MVGEFIQNFKMLLKDDFEENKFTKSKVALKPSLSYDFVEK